MNTKQGIILVGIGLLLFCVFVGTASAKTWYVDDSGGADFTKIRDAVSAAGDGDTIIVRDGWYYETIVVNKSLTIRSENGSKKTHIEFGGVSEEKTYPLFNITADFVNISGFGFHSTPECYNPAIHCRGNYCNISNNRIFTHKGIYLKNIQHCTIADNEIDITAGYKGLSLESSDYNIIMNNVINDWSGLILDSSSGNAIINNTGKGEIHLDRSNDNNISGNSLDIYLEYSNTYNTIRGNSFDYMSLRGSHYNNIIENNVSKDGIRVDLGSIWNNIIGNNFLNESEGLILYESNDNYVINNTFENSGISIIGYFKVDFNRYTIEGNTVNERPIYYYKNTGGVKIPEDAGAVILANCTDMTVENINASFGSIGIELAYTDDSDISNNIVSNNKRYGIYLVYSDDNNITNNDISNNICGLTLKGGYDNKIAGNNVNSNGYGILGYSSDNLVYNNYFNNTNNVVDQNINIWNISKTGGVNIVGGLYLGGNYWSDYMGKDTDGDGLGDTLLPYTSAANIRYGGDYLPLVKPTVLSVFDTGAPANPYPSIFGTHNGTITPNQTITVSNLYTYPCPGTGGHTESIKIYKNSKLIANGTWNGYVGDWHNLTLHNATGAPYVTLLEGHEYNYVIKTGSYPQVHHTDNLEVPSGAGTITCDKFIDANGRIHYDWIPAIRLWA